MCLSVHPRTQKPEGPFRMMMMLHLMMMSCVFTYTHDDDGLCIDDDDELCIDKTAGSQLKKLAKQKRIRLECTNARTRKNRHTKQIERDREKDTEV